MMNADLSETAKAQTRTLDAEPSQLNSTNAAMSSTHSFLRSARFLPLAMWLGAAVFLSFTVAPSAFDVLPTRELAGALVSRTLATINVAGFVVAIFALLATPFGGRAAGRIAKWVELGMLLVLAAATGIGQWVIAAQLRILRTQLGPTIDTLAVDDPARVAFRAFHGYSVVALSVGMLAALVACILIARRRD